MGKRVLFCATVDYHFKAFHLPYLKWFKERGWQVDIAASGNIQLPYTDRKYTIPIERSPLKSANIRAYQQLANLIEQNDYALIHCHTPLGGVLARIAARKARKKGTKVIYTAHGFHFCKGVPKTNWLLYYPVERYLARHTDCLITINQEDYQLATNHHFRAEEITYVPGVGVDTTTFKPVEESRKRTLKIAFGFQPEELLLFNVGEFNQNKNQQFLIKAMVEIVKIVPNARLLLAGEGELLESCQQLAHSLGVSKQIIFLGFRNDIADILAMCDIAVAASFREGLPVNVMEAMASGLPIVASDNRGHRELIEDEKSGYLIYDLDEKLFAEKIKELVQPALRDAFGSYGRKVMQANYDTSHIVKRKSHIYERYMGESEEIPWTAP